MIESLYKLFIGHLHNYEIIQQDEYDKYSRDEDKLPYKKVLHLVQKCSICGKIKHTKINKD